MLLFVPRGDSWLWVFLSVGWPLSCWFYFGFLKFQHTLDGLLGLVGFWGLADWFWWRFSFGLVSLIEILYGVVGLVS